MNILDDEIKLTVVVSLSYRSGNRKDDIILDTTQISLDSSWESNRKPTNRRTVDRFSIT